jgi:hypothetical protein
VGDGTFEVLDAETWLTVLAAVDSATLTVAGEAVDVVRSSCEDAPESAKVVVEGGKERFGADT